MKLEIAKSRQETIREKIKNLDLSSSQKEIFESVLFDPVAYMDDPRFRKPTAMRPIMKNEVDPPQTKTLPKSDEQTLFLQMNYARYKMCIVRRRILRNKTWRKKDILELLNWYDLQQDLRSKIITANMGLVLSMAKRYGGSGVEFTDLISEGSMALMRAAEKFDAGRGLKFSTYACRAILKSFSRVAKQNYRYHRLFPAQLDIKLERDDYLERRRQQQHEGLVDDVRSIVRDNLADLSDIEQRIVSMRFPMDQDDSKSLTLKEVGDRLGLTKERIRQIQNKALVKLRIAAEDRMTGS